MQSSSTILILTSRLEIYPDFNGQIESKLLHPFTRFLNDQCYVLSMTGVEQAPAGSNGAAKASFQTTLTYIHINICFSDSLQPPHHHSFQQ